MVCAVAVLTAGAVFLVGGPATALTSPPEPLDRFKLGVPSSLLDSPGLSPSELAAWEEITRNNTGAAKGSPRELVVPSTSRESSRWLKAGGTLSSLFFVLPVVGTVGDAVTGGYFKESADENCQTPGWFGDLTQFAGTLMGFSCDVTASPLQDRSPDYEPLNPGVAATGFPLTAVNGSTSLRLDSAPFWSSSIITTSGLQEGWVYPTTTVGNPTVYMRFQSRAANGTLVRGTNLAGFTGSNLSGYTTVGTFPQCAAPVRCLVGARLAASQGTTQTWAISTFAAGYGSNYDVVAPDMPPYFSRAAGSGSPAPSAGPGQSAQVTMSTVLTDSAGLTATCTTAAFRETDLLIPKPCEPTLPGGWTVTKHRTVFMEPLGNTDLVKRAPLQDFDTSAGYQDWRTKYPLCATTVCELELESIAEGDCFQIGTKCADWFADPNKSTKYRCLYAGQVVGLAECSRYAPTFKPDAQANGTVYAPAPGAPSGTQTSVRPSVAEDAPGAVADPENKGPCFPTGFGVFNPVEWILKPVGCALQAAFVPRASVLASQLDANAAKWDQKMPVQLSKIIGGLEFIGPASGCGGITVDVFFLGPPFQIMDACPGSPLAGMATWSRLFGNVVFTVYGAVALTRHIGRIFGYGGVGNGESS